MPLLKSLLCLQGVDNGRRYLLINLCCYLIVTAFSSIIALSNLILILICLFCIPLVTAATIRRVRDAHFKLAIAAIPVLVFVTSIFMLSFTESSARWFILVLALITTLAFAMLNNAQARNHKRQQDYILGYAGPIDLTSAPSQTPFQHSYHQRIEPVIQPQSSQGIVDDEVMTNIGEGRDIGEDRDGDMQFEPIGEINPGRYSAPNENIYAQNNNPKQFQWLLQLFNLATVKSWYAQTNTAIFMMITGFVAAVSLVLIAIFWPSAQDELSQVQPIEQVETTTRQRLNKIEMPDNFWIMHDQHNAITLAWQGETVAQGEIIKEGNYWSAKTALGDKSCAELKFSQNSRFRSQQVVMKNQGDYYADFSPVDSKAIIEAIALKSRFSLCGYEFSLKGTQAILMSHKQYATYLMQ